MDGRVVQRRKLQTVGNWQRGGFKTRPPRKMAASRTAKSRNRVPNAAASARPVGG